MKNFNCKVDDALDLRIALYSIHLGTTKAIAGALAMSNGIPEWVMSLPPSEARRLTVEQEINSGNAERNPGRGDT